MTSAVASSARSGSRVMVMSRVVASPPCSGQPLGVDDLEQVEERFAEPAGVGQPVQRVAGLGQDTAPRPSGSLRGLVNASR